MVHDAVLASAPHADTFGYSMPPPGLLRLGGELERRGLRVRLEDLAYRLAQGRLPADDGLVDACAELLLEDGAPRLALGLSCMGATLPAALAIAERAKRRAPGLFVVLGGPGTTSVETRLVERFPAVDAIVRGEGERTLPELLGRLAAGDDLAGVAGVTWRDGAGRVRVEDERPPIADLDELPRPAWHLLPPLDAYKAITGEDDGLVPVDSGRGCVYDCSFCSIGRTWRRRSRTLPVARLVDEVLEAAALPAARQVYLCHDIFGADRSHALDLCAELERRGAPVPFEVRARVDHLDEELVAAMGRAGCYRVLLGVETADAGLLAVHGKRQRPGTDVLACVERLDAAGVAAILSLVLGLPGEGDAELGRTLDLCLDAALAAPVHLSLHLPNPQPGCELGERDGGASRPVADVVPDMAWGAGTTAPERALIEAHPDLFGTFALMVDAAGGLERLLWLRTLADELPPVLMRYPRTYALLARELGTDALGTYRAWRADGRSFESFVRARGDGPACDALDWEQAIVRTAALGDAPPGRVRAAAVVRVRFDPTTDPRGWREGPPPQRAPRALAVARGAANAARTVAVADGLADLLRELDGRDPSELAADPRLTEVLPALVARGLLTLPADARVGVPR